MFAHRHHRFDFPRIRHVLRSWLWRIVVCEQRTCLLSIRCSYPPPPKKYIYISNTYKQIIERFIEKLERKCIFTYLLFNTQKQFSNYKIISFFSRAARRGVRFEMIVQIGLLYSFKIKPVNLIRRKILNQLSRFDATIKNIYASLIHRRITFINLSIVFFFFLFFLSFRPSALSNRYAYETIVI